MRKYILFFMLLAFSMGAAAQVIERKSNYNQKLKSNQLSKTFTVNGVSFDMVFVEGGTFQMGSTFGSDASPVHQVTLSNYYIGKTEVTQKLWQVVMGSNPSVFKGENHPVNNVSWNDCKEFIRKLNSLMGESFRLPTEAEWEFAARGGKKSKGYKYSGSNNWGSVAWCAGNTNKVHPVGSKSPNELDLYDMSGNVDEWCVDWHGSYPSSPQTNPTGPSTGSDRVLRGGCWYDIPMYCRSSYRGGDEPTSRGSYRGLRLAY